MDLSCTTLSLNFDMHYLGLEFYTHQSKLEFEFGLS
jgi:hypothetical protein